MPRAAGRGKSVGSMSALWPCFRISSTEHANSYSRTVSHRCHDYRVAVPRRCLLEDRQRACPCGARARLELDRPLFYPMGGGQWGDRGALLRANGERIAILDTRKGDAIDSVRHVPAPGMPQPEIGETLTLEIDWERRYSLMRLHTALH